MANTKSYYQYKAWKILLNNPKVHSYKLIKEGKSDSSVHNIIYTHWKILMIDDQFAIIGTAGQEQAGFTNDIDMSLGIYDPTLVKNMRENIWADYLNVPFSTTNPFLENPIEGIQQLWPKIAKENGRVRTYWPKKVEHYKIYDNIFEIFEPCGYTDVSKCQILG